MYTWLDDEERDHCGSAHADENAGEKCFILHQISIFYHVFAISAWSNIARFWQWYLITLAIRVKLAMMQEMSMKERLQRRLTKIVCTIGPACNTKERLEEVVNAGMNVARFNLTHASAEKQLPVIHSLMDIRRNKGVSIGILLDVRCAQVRTGVVQQPIMITKGATVYFGIETLRSSAPSTSPFISVDYSAFGKDVRKANILLLDNGEMSFDILSISSKGLVKAEARQDGKIGSKRHVNMPGASISLPTFTESDWDDIACAVRENIDYLAISFVRTAEDIQEVQRYIKRKKSDVRVIAKIETQQAIDHLEEILEVSDGIMVARGDLGAEIPFEKVPVIQDHIVQSCMRMGKPAIVATHMLESMIEHPLPTRAEVTDVAHAATTMTDSTMLSGETASGRHPCVAIDAMHRILVATEKHLKELRVERRGTPATTGEARALAAVTLATSINVASIVVMTRSGKSAIQISKHRPLIPIIAITEDQRVANRLALHYGIFPIVCSFDGELEDSAIRGLRAAVESGHLTRGEEIVLVSGTRITGGNTISIQARKVA